MRAMRIEKTFFVGDTEVEPRRNRILVTGEERPVEPLVMRVLVRLVEDAGSVVTRDELIESVWPDGFAGDASLSRAIWGLRKALGDNADSPRFVETIPRVGYRLIADVEWPRATDPKGQPERGMFGVYPGIEGGGAATRVPTGDGYAASPVSRMGLVPDARPVRGDKSGDRALVSATAIRRLRAAVGALCLLCLALALALVLGLSTRETGYVKQLKIKGEDGRVDTVRVESASPVELTTTLD